ncbi:MAG: DUF1566 domain-containing protein [Rhodoferax sp.]|nr:DUF1566 domain-containing protein [Rhodoferax sp.]
MISISSSGVKYSVVVSNSAGTVTSNEATLTVNAFTSYSLVPNASGGNYDKTECVIDNRTGLFWEGKTASGSRAGTNTYTNYDSTSSAQKLVLSPYAGFVNPSQSEIDASNNSIYYIKWVNDSALCGFTDWRLPTKDELFSLVDTRQAPGNIDSFWFPNTQSTQYSGYWTPAPYNNLLYSTWVVSFYYASFGNGNRYNADNYSIRLVRANQ